MKKAFVIAAAVAAWAAFGGVPVKWSVETSRADERVIDVYHGETLEMEVTFKSYGKILELPTNEVAATFWQTNGMNTAYWRTNDVEIIASNGVMRTTFGPEKDVGAKTLRGFIGIAGQIYRAAFVLRFKDAPGYDPAIVEWPYRRLDFNTIEIHNAPYYTKEEADEQFAAKLDRPANVDEVVWTNRFQETTSMRHGWHINGIDNEFQTDGFVMWRRAENGLAFPLYWFRTDGWIWLYDTNGAHRASMGYAGVYDGWITHDWTDWLSKQSYVNAMYDEVMQPGTAEAEAVKTYVQGKVSNLETVTIPNAIADHAATEAANRDAAIEAVTNNLMQETRRQIDTADANTHLYKEGSLKTEWMNEAGEIVKVDYIINSYWESVSGDSLILTNIDTNTWCDDRPETISEYGSAIYFGWFEYSGSGYWEAYIMMGPSKMRLGLKEGAADAMAITNIYMSTTVERRFNITETTNVIRRVAFTDEIAQGMTTNDVKAIVTNEVPEFTQWECNPPLYGMLETQVIRKDGYWYIAYVGGDTCSVANENTDPAATNLTWESGWDGSIDTPPIVFTATRSPTGRTQNELGLARMSDLPEVAAAAVYDVHDLRWDEEEQILYWCKFVGGHDLCIAVTNINLTHPTNSVLLKAWREANQ